MSIILSVVLGVFLFLMIPFTFNGILDAVMAYRLIKKGSRKGIVDKTAGFFHWNTFKWAAASQTEAVKKVAPEIGQDLTEAMGLRKDDGRVT